MITYDTWANNQKCLIHIKFSLLKLIHWIDTSDISWQIIGSGPCKVWDVLSRKTKIGSINIVLLFSSFWYNGGVGKWKIIDGWSLELKRERERLNANSYIIKTYFRWTLVASRIKQHPLKDEVQLYGL